jgi:hypothetical protein
MEPAAAEGESGPLRRDDGQWNFLSQVKESFSVNVMFLRRGRGSLRLGLFLLDPLRMVLDEFLDAYSRHAQRGAHRQAAVALDDEGNRLAPGMYEMVNGDGHGQ